MDHIQFDKTMHDIFWLFGSEKRSSVITYKVRRAFSMVGSFNQVNKLSFIKL